MDEQDQQWLDTLNAERRKEQLDPISYEAFEIIIDRLEKEWFALVKRIPSRFSIGAAMDDDEFPEDSYCAICDDNECENLNAIVFCDGCNLAVHQECYGVPYIPEGQWLCRKCTVSPDRPVSCVLCPNEGGAFKQTTEGAWAHLLCAMWIPETGVGNTVYMEPIDGIKAIPKARWRLRCYLCNKKGGACIQCEHRSCFTAFHVMCARHAGLLIQPRHRSDDDEETEDTKPETWAAYCHHHLPPEQKVTLRERIRGDEAMSDTDSVSDVSTSELLHQPPRPGTSAYNSIVSKSARAYNKLYSSGPLPVPNYMVHRVMDYIQRIHFRRKPLAVSMIVRYWSLKRQDMRGAPLLKRLHIEPWTVGHFVDERTSALKLAKLQYLFRLREDLEKVRLLTELVRKREKEKLRQLTLWQSMLDMGLLHKQAQLRKALASVKSLDKAEWFLLPVSVDDVPDYYDIIAHPMDWTTIQKKIDDMAYNTWDEWATDVTLVCTNAMQYNRADSLIHKTAQKILKQLPSITQQYKDDTFSDDTSGLEPPAPLLAMLRAPHASIPPGHTPMEAPPDNADMMQAFLTQWYTIPPAKVTPSPSPSPAPSPVKKAAPVKQKRSIPAAPTRRSTRHAAPDVEPAGPVSEPRVLEELNAKDSFKYFNVGWLLPPGTRRGNRPRPEPRAPKPRLRKKVKVAAKPDAAEADSSSLSELSDA
ncbi:MOZ/MORF histone acetyltransferase complex protein [Malassezia pachydermatis]